MVQYPLYVVDTLWEVIGDATLRLINIGLEKALQGISAFQIIMRGPFVLLTGL